MEGQQKMDDHIDKLLNYIRYWQASGETSKPPHEQRHVCRKSYRRGGSAAGSFPMDTAWKSRALQ